MSPTQIHEREHEQHEVTDKTLFGFWVYIMSDCLLFAALFATYVVLRNNTWGAPQGPDIFSLPFVLLETLILLTSSFTCGLAVLASYRNHTRAVLVSLSITALLGISFLTLEVSEFARLMMSGAGPDKSAFLSAFFTLVGTHGAHVSAGLIWMVTLLIQMYRRGLSATNSRRLLMLSLFWHFLDIVWIFIFSIVYLMGVL